MSVGEETFAGELIDSPERSQRDEVVGVLTFNNSLRGAYRELRFKGLPAMEAAFEAGHTESIAEHMWGTQLLWRNLQGTCPALAASVDSEYVTEMLGMHDIGEISAGDIGRNVTVNGESVDKHLAERIGLENQLLSLPEEAQNRYLSLFDEFEEKDSDAQTVESNVANLIDSMHGDMHFLDHASNVTDKDIDMTRSIITKYTKPKFVKLLATFESEGNQPAYEDVMNIIDAYCGYIADHPNVSIREIGITPLDLASY